MQSAYLKSNSTDSIGGVSKLLRVTCTCLLPTKLLCSFNSCGVTKQLFGCDSLKCMEKRNCFRAFSIVYSDVSFQEEELETVPNKSRENHNQGFGFGDLKSQDDEPGVTIRSQIFDLLNTPISMKNTNNQKKKKKSKTNKQNDHSTQATASKNDGFPKKNIEFMYSPTFNNSLPDMSLLAPEVPNTSDLEWSEEVFEESNATISCDFFQSLQSDNEALIWYNYAKHPIAYTEINRSLERCMYCKLELQFEYQILPTILHEFAVSDSLSPDASGMDFGTIMAFCCSCLPTNTIESQFATGAIENVEILINEVKVREERTIIQGEFTP